MVATLLPVFVVAALSAAMLTLLVRGATSDPRVARLGGIAIAVTWIGVLLAIYVAGPDPLRLPLVSLPLPEILGAACIVFMLGVWDDLRSVPPARKILVLALAATLVAGVIRIDHFTVSGTTWQLGALAITVTVLWIAGITEAFEQLDPLNGLGTWVAITGAATCAAIVVVRGDIATAIVLTSLIGALVGLLPYSRSGPFLGSSGCLLCGFVLSVTAITGIQKSATALAIGALILLFALPIEDILTWLVRRRAGRERQRGSRRA